MVVEGGRCGNVSSLSGSVTIRSLTGAGLRFDYKGDVIDYFSKCKETTNEKQARLEMKCSQRLDGSWGADSRRRTLKSRAWTVKSETASPPSHTHHHFSSPLSSLPT